jgi:hypothetical protein
MTLRRLVLTFDDQDGIRARVLYRRHAGPGPATKTPQREAAHLVRTGLERVLEALDAGDVVALGTAGFETREDVLGLPLASSNSEKTMKKGA